VLFLKLNCLSLHARGPYPYRKGVTNHVDTRSGTPLGPPLRFVTSDVVAGHSAVVTDANCTKCKRHHKQCANYHIT